MLQTTTKTHLGLFEMKFAVKYIKT